MCVRNAGQEQTKEQVHAELLVQWDRALGNIFENIFGL